MDHRGNNNNNNNNNGFTHHDNYNRYNRYNRGCDDTGASLGYPAMNVPFRRYLGDARGEHELFAGPPLPLHHFGFRSTQLPWNTTLPPWLTVIEAKLAPQNLSPSGPRLRRSCRARRSTYFFEKTRLGLRMLESRQRRRRQTMRRRRRRTRHESRPLLKRGRQRRRSTKMKSMRYLQDCSLGLQSRRRLRLLEARKKARRKRVRRMRSGP
jgi:hypothetical protein